jgi:hypothetical protein
MLILKHVQGFVDAQLTAHQEQYKNVGEEVRKNNLEAMKEQMAIFKAKLEEFALKHKSDIRKDPQFRARFHQMCANIGVDPLASNKASTCTGVVGWAMLGWVSGLSSYRARISHK